MSGLIMSDDKGYRMFWGLSSCGGDGQGETYSSSSSACALSEMGPLSRPCGGAAVPSVPSMLRPRGWMVREVMVLAGADFVDGR